MEIIDVNTVYGAGTSSVFRNSPYDLEKYLISNGITKALTLNSSGIKYNFLTGNEETLADVCKSSSLLPVATIDPRGFFGDEKIFVSLKEKGFKAVRFFPEIQNWKLNNIVFAKLMEFNSAVGLPFIINTSEFGDISLLDSIYNYDFPVICSGVSYKNASEFILFALKHNAVFADSSRLSAYYVLEMLTEKISSEKIVFGSEAPAKLSKVSVDFLMKSSLSDTEKENIFSKNILNII